MTESGRRPAAIEMTAGLVSAAPHPLKRRPVRGAFFVSGFRSLGSNRLDADGQGAGQVERVFDADADLAGAGTGLGDQNLAGAQLDAGIADQAFGTVQDDVLISDQKPDPVLLGIAAGFQAQHAVFPVLGIDIRDGAAGGDVGVETVGELVGGSRGAREQARRHKCRHARHTANCP